MRFLFFLTIFVHSSCYNGEMQKEKERLAQENAKLKDDLQKKEEASAYQATLVSEHQQRLEDKIKEQDDMRQLALLAEDEPQTMSNLTLRNETQQGTFLSSGELFEEDKVRFIGWKADFTDNAVKAGKKAYGKIYARYLRKIGTSNSWSILDQQGSFTKRDGSVIGYTRSFNMIYDGREFYSFGSRLGSAEGGDFAIGKWCLELFWEVEETKKAYHLGNKYFEVY